MTSDPNESPMGSRPGRGNAGASGNASHTPAPWRIEPSVVGECESYIVGANGATIGWLRQFADTPANAAVIAVAPEMLATLLELVLMIPSPEMCEPGSQMYRAGLRARAVLAKVRP